MTRSTIRLLLAMAALAAGAAAEPLWPALPDPIGLGPRLATIDWLADHGLRLLPGATDAEVLAAYTRATIDVDAIRERAEMDRLRYILHANHGIDAPIDADHAALAQMLGAARDAQRMADATLPARLTLAPAPVATDPAMDPVPLRYRIRFDDLAWRTIDAATGAVAWRRGGDKHRLPGDYGGVQSRWITWSDQTSRILAYVEDAPEPRPRFTLTTTIGCFQATRLTDNAWEVVFTDNAGSAQTFRTCADEALALVPADALQGHEHAQCRHEQTRAEPPPQASERRDCNHGSDRRESTITHRIIAVPLPRNLSSPGGRLVATPEAKPAPAIDGTKKQTDPDAAVELAALVWR